MFFLRSIHSKRKGEEEDQKKGWLNTIENDMKLVDVCVGDVEIRD
jgi:hypothetical protein